MDIRVIKTYPNNIYALSRSLPIGALLVRSDRDLDSDAVKVISSEPGISHARAREGHDPALSVGDLLRVLE